MHLALALIRRVCHLDMDPTMMTLSCLNIAAKMDEIDDRIPSTDHIVNSMQRSEVLRC